MIWFWMGVVCGGPLVVGLLVAAMVEVFFFFFFFWLWLVVVNGCGYGDGGEEVNFIFSI